VSVDSVLDDAFTLLLAKARTRLPDEGLNPPLPTTININFDGVGLPLTVNMAGLVEITFPCTILGCHIYAGTAGSTGLQPSFVTATVDLLLSQQGTWASGAATLYNTGTIPTITAAVETSVSITGWIVNLQPGDLILWRLATFSGTATWMSVTLPIRRLDTQNIGVLSLFDSSSINFTNASGSPFVVRG
jgi:hypothetical protein